MVVILVDEEVTIGRIVEATPNESYIKIHLYDTVELGSTTHDPSRWTKAWFPLYLTEDHGLVVKKAVDAVGLTPVEVRIRRGDVLGVPFQLPVNNKLNFAQRRVIDGWNDGVVY